MGATPGNIDQIIEDLAREMDSLAKGEGSPPGEESSAGSPSPGGEGSPPSGSPPPAPAGGPPPPDASAPPPVPPAGPPGAPGSAPPAGPGGPGGMPGDPAQVAQMVQGMDDAALQAFYAATRQELLTRGISGSPSATEPPAPAGGPPPPDASAPPPVPPAGPPGAPPAGRLGKSESDPVLKQLLAEVQASRAETAALKKSVEDNATNTARAVRLLAGTPLRKGMTEVPFVPRTQEAQPEVAQMSRGEIDKTLQALDKSTLKKSDRDAINQFYNAGGRDVRPIQHLLRKP
jgi:hypothetical protein